MNILHTGPLNLNLTFCSRDICATLVSAAAEVTVVYQNGLPVISVSLPSRRERCQFTLKPLSDCVGVFLQQLQAEDRGIDRVAIYSTGTLTSTKVHTRVATIHPFVPSGFYDSSPLWFQVDTLECGHGCKFDKCCMSNQMTFFF